MYHINFFTIQNRCFTKVLIIIAKDYACDKSTIKYNLNIISMRELLFTWNIFFFFCLYASDKWRQYKAELS